MPGHDGAGVAAAVDGEADVSEAFQILFSIPQIDSAFMRNPAGGARMKIDIDQATVAAASAMMDAVNARSGTVFAAAIVIVEQAAAEPHAEPPRFGMKRRGKANPKTG